MLTVLIIASFFVLGIGIEKRFERYEDRKSSLESLREDLEAAELWGLPTDDHARRVKEIIDEYTLRGFDKFKFELTCWASHISGTVLAIISIFYWIIENPEKSLGEFWSGLTEPIVFGCLWAFVMYQRHRVTGLTEKIEMQRRLMKDFAKMVRSMKERRIEAEIKIKERLDKLEKSGA